MKLAQETAYRNGTLKGAVHATGDYSQDTPELPSDYEEKAKHVAARQVVVAGYRLVGQVEERILGGRPNIL